MHRLRWLGAVVAVFVAVALTVIAPAGGTDYHPPTIRHCHKWPGLTEVHWNMQSLHEAYIANSVSLVTFEWDGAIGRPSPYDGWVMRTSKRRRP